MPTPAPLLALFKSRPEQALTLGSCLAVFAIVAIVSYLLLRERESVERSAVRASNNIVQLIENDVLRNVELYDQSLRGVMWGVRHPQLSSLTPELRQQILFRQAVTTPGQGELLWLDAQGKVQGRSSGNVPLQADFANTAAFQAHRAHPGLGLMLTPPSRRQLDELGWSLNFSRRISSSSGAFLGVTVGALPLAYFDTLFQRLEIGKESSVNLLSTDGQLLARQPVRDTDPQVGGNYLKRVNFQRILAEQSGSFTAASVARGGALRIYTFAKVANLPLIVLVVHSADEVLHSWRRTAWLVGAATGVLCVGILWLSVLLGRELRRRQRAELSLAELAATDSLTGLPNRRRLDEVLKLEWTRAQRSGKPLAVLMVDIDHFKAFNQRYGHAGGDHALREVALALGQCIRRPADLAARYGGEEFQLVLPETDALGARVIAERIREAVEGLPAFGDGSVAITVSIGIAVHTQKTQCDLATVLGLADEALYRAKANGRNRIEQAQS